jgi:hypothetical protein
MAWPPPALVPGWAPFTAGAVVSTSAGSSLFAPRRFRRVAPVARGGLVDSRRDRMTSRVSKEVGAGNGPRGEGRLRRLGYGRTVATRLRENRFLGRQPVVDGEDGELHAREYPQLVEDVRQVMFDGGLSDAELCGDIFVAGRRDNR